MNQVEAAATAYRQALTLQEALVRDRPDDDRRRNQLARILNNLGRVHQKSGRTDQAAEVLQRALSLGKELVGRHPNDFEYAHVLGRCP